MEFGDSYLKTSGHLWQYLRDEPNAALKNSESFKLKVNITAYNPADGNTEDSKIAVPLKYKNTTYTNATNQLRN